MIQLTERRNTMTKIILTDQQVKILSQATTPVPVCHPMGAVLGTLDPEQRPEFIAELKRRAASPGPWFSGEQVQRHLAGLDEAWKREGPFDEGRMLELLEQLRALDQQ